MLKAIIKALAIGVAALLSYLSILLTAVALFEGSSKASSLLHGHISPQEAYPAGAILLTATLCGLMYEVVVRPLLRAQKEIERTTADASETTRNEGGSTPGEAQRHGPRRPAMALTVLCLILSAILLALPMQREQKAPHGPSAGGQPNHHQGSGKSGKRGSHKAQSRGSQPGGHRALARSETKNRGVGSTGTDEVSGSESSPSASASEAGPCGCSSPAPSPTPEPCGCSSPCTCSTPPAGSTPHPSGGGAGEVESEPEPNYEPEPEYEEPEYEEEI